MKIRMKIVILLFLTALLTNSLFAQDNFTTSGRLKAVQLTQEGDAFLQMGDWERALFSYTNAIQADVTYADAYMKRGQLYDRTTHSAEAQQDYQTAIKLNPYINVFYDQQVRMQLLAFNYYGRLTDISAEEELQLNVTDNLKRNVDNFIALGMYKKAILKLDSLENIEENLEAVYQRLALIHLINDDLINAKKAIYQANKINEEAYFTLDLKGLLALKSNDFQTAISYFDRAIATDENQAVSHYHRGVAYHYLGDEELAIQNINAAIEIDKTKGVAYFRRALLLKEIGDLEGALKDYNMAIDMDSSYYEAYFNRAVTFQFLGDLISAEKDINSAIKLKGNLPELWNVKGNILLLRGEMAEALRAYDTAISYDIYFADAYYNKGIANLLFNRPLQGCEAFNESARLGYEPAKEMITYFCGAY